MLQTTATQFFCNQRHLGEMLQQLSPKGTCDRRKPGWMNLSCRYSRQRDAHSGDRRLW